MHCWTRCLFCSFLFHIFNIKSYISCCTRSISGVPRPELWMGEMAVGEGVLCFSVSSKLIDSMTFRDDSFSSWLSLALLLTFDGGGFFIWIILFFVLTSSISLDVFSSSLLKFFLLTICFLKLPTNLAIGISSSNCSRDYCWGNFRIGLSDTLFLPLFPLPILACSSSSSLKWFLSKKFSQSSPKPLRWNSISIFMRSWW